MNIIHEYGFSSKALVAQFIQLYLDEKVESMNLGKQLCHHVKWEIF